MILLVILKGATRKRPSLAYKPLAQLLALPAERQTSPAGFAIAAGAAVVAAGHNIMQSRADQHR